MFVFFLRLKLSDWPGQLANEHQSPLVSVAETLEFQMLKAIPGFYVHARIQTQVLMFVGQGLCLPQEEQTYSSVYQTSP